MSAKIKFLSCFSLLMIMFLSGNSLKAGDVIIMDSRHYSNVFGEVRNYRIFLPPDYDQDPLKRYPVIYFFHGWSQRYFGFVGQDYANMDRGDDNKGDNIAAFVSSHEVIVVKADGYNRSADEKYSLRPYNVSPVETFRQFPLYFPELVEHIDASYRTVADRNHRAVSGLSMGGFMTMWVSGKYPHLVSAAGNFCGSAEFMVGPRLFPVEMRHADMYRNYEGVNVRLNYGDKDFIRYYHRDLNRIWTQVVDNYEYKIYDAAHSTCGMGEMFGFILRTFENPPAKPEKWNHIDVYPDFTVWDYKVMSDRVIPGFTILENVDKRGFRCSVREFLPDGELMPFVSLVITTPPLYDKNQEYIINDIDTRNRKSSRHMTRSDNQGRLMIRISGSSHEIGINNKGDEPEIAVDSYFTENMKWAVIGKEVRVSVRLLNKGLRTAEGITATMIPARKTAAIISGVSAFPDIPVNEVREGRNLFSFIVKTDSIEIEKFRLIIRDRKKNQWDGIIEIPLRTDLPGITDFEIADGRTMTVVKAGTGSETVLLGRGNGDGKANPGESVVILVRDNGKLYRTSLLYNDDNLDPYGTRIRMSDNWTNLDHVGGSAKYSVPLISSQCPAGHRAEMLAEYWLPEYPNHIIRRGKINLTVDGKDNTPPVLRWVKIPGDNVIQVKLYDGSKIRSVKAKFTSRADPQEFSEVRFRDPKKTFEVQLNDDGKEGDRAGSDNVFSCRIPFRDFFIYNVEIEAADSSGNTMNEAYPESFIIH